MDEKVKWTYLTKGDIVTELAKKGFKVSHNKTLTIPADNGKEYAGHETIKEQLGANVYFAHPYCSWERGLNENTNGLIRQYFTKGSSFENITDGEVEAVMNKLNHRPRKTLNFKTPHTVFYADTLQEAA